MSRASWRLTAWLTAWPAGRLPSLVVGWLVDLLAGWLAGRLVGGVFGRLVLLASRLAGLLATNIWPVTPSTPTCAGRPERLLALRSPLVLLLTLLAVPLMRWAMVMLGDRFAAWQFKALFGVMQAQGVCNPCGRTTSRIHSA